MHSFLFVNVVNLPVQGCKGVNLLTCVIPQTVVGPGMVTVGMFPPPPRSEVPSIALAKYNASPLNEKTN